MGSSAAIPAPGRRSPRVSDILDERRHVGELRPGLVAGLSIGAHVAFVVFLIVISRPKPVPFLPTPIRVGIVSPARLGRPDVPPAAAPAPPAQVVEPAPSQPAPAAKARPVIEKPAQEKVVPPSANAMPEPKRGKQAKATPPPAVASKGTSPRAGTGPAGPPGLELPSAAGSLTGDAHGSAGASVAGFDTNFPFAYYADQLVALIGASWSKPAAPEGTFCVLTFRVLRSGQVTEVKVETPSGMPFYDRAAERALYAANPLPPLPAEFKGEQLGVHLKFQ